MPSWRRVFTSDEAKIEALCGHDDLGLSDEIAGPRAESKDAQTCAGRGAGASDIGVGEWVTVKPEHDTPPVFRNYAPTRGQVKRIVDGIAEVWVPIGMASVDEHSQAVPYELDQLDCDQGWPQPLPPPYAADDEDKEAPC